MQLSRLTRFLVLILFLTICVPGTIDPVQAKVDSINLPKVPISLNNEGINFPIRAAFYYPWFPQSWEQSGYRYFSEYTPSLGYYSLDNEDTIAEHITAMQYAKIQVGIASWWGQNHHTDLRMNSLLNVGARKGFIWSIYMENEGYGNPSTESIQSDLDYIQKNFALSNAYLRINARFVVFVYNDPQDNCSMVDRWTKANNVNAYLVMKIFPGYRSCSNQPDAWHQYAPDLAIKQVDSDSITISPGFSMIGRSKPFLARDLLRWSKNIQEMNESETKFHLITTFNEWGEGSAVESAQEWATTSGYGLYLDALHQDGSDIPVSDVPSQTALVKINTWNWLINQQ